MSEVVLNMTFCWLISCVYSECHSGGAQPALWSQNRTCQPVQQCSSIQWRRRGNAAGRQTCQGQSREDQWGSRRPEDTGEGAERKGDKEREWCQGEQRARSPSLGERQGPARKGSHGESSKRARQEGREEEGTSQDGQKEHKCCQLIFQVLERWKAEQSQHWRHEGKMKNNLLLLICFLHL